MISTQKFVSLKVSEITMGTDLKVQWRRTILLRWSTKTNCTTLMINYFQEQYKEAIDASRKQLDAMFTRTYGSFYQSHTQKEPIGIHPTFGSEISIFRKSLEEYMSKRIAFKVDLPIFIKFFDDLQEFYAGQKYISLKPTLDRFFFDLFRTLLLILNPTDEIREDNSDCSKSSLALRAFGDIPLKMVRQLERSLGAARSLTHALKSSSDILQDILQKELSTDCQINATQMKYCAHCMPSDGRTSALRFDECTVPVKLLV
ncbi:hypothetical protein LOAG_00111 [Loa loa]|uniref:Uncharacterized protein n=1 Tax=Loa loa TaxID=7209 RepID=A0A1S0UCK5_LOALO|nr:hypothetical protein LOAG_00111 [Loa loa]EFO28379.1 hypothetical protein LOAG_00111 [Loa loa]